MEQHNRHQFSAEREEYVRNVRVRGRMPIDPTVMPKLYAVTECPRCNKILYYGDTCYCTGSGSTPRRYDETAKFKQEKRTPQEIAEAEFWASLHSSDD